MIRSLVSACIGLVLGCQQVVEESPVPAVPPVESSDLANATDALPLRSIPLFPASLKPVLATVVDSSSLRYVSIADPMDKSEERAGAKVLYSIKIDSLAQLEELLALLKKRKGQVEAPIAIPTALSNVPVGRKKKLFFSALQPIVSFHNSVLEDRRLRLIQLSDKGDLKAADRLFIAEMSQRYRLKAKVSYRDTLLELREKIGLVPPSLVLAQAAIESGWGSSRFCREGNNLFGQRVWSKKVDGLAPQGVQGARFRLAVFPTISASIRSYMHNLNTHPAYESLRSLRKDRRQRGAPIDGYTLAGGLVAYSTRGEDYVEDVRRLMNSNNLEHLDH